MIGPGPIADPEGGPSAKVSAGSTARATSRGSAAWSPGAAASAAPGMVAAVTTASTAIQCRLRLATVPPGHRGATRRRTSQSAPTDPMIATSRARDHPGNPGWRFLTRVVSPVACHSAGQRVLPSHRQAHEPPMSLLSDSVTGTRQDWQEIDNRPDRRVRVEAPTSPAESPLRLARRHRNWTLERVVSEIDSHLGGSGSRRAC